MSWRINTANLLLLTSLFLGLLLPTSLNSGSTRQFEMLGQLIATAFYLTTLLKQSNKIDIYRLLVSLAITLTLFLFTFSGSFITTGFSIGAYPPYLIFSLMILSTWKIQGIRLQLSRILLLLDIILIILSFCIIFNNQPVKDLFLNYYASGYDDLLPNMLARSKPVTFFATHSVAGFYYFLFFFLNYETYRRKRTIYYLIIALLFLGMMVMLRSNTSFAYIALALVYLLATSVKNVKQFAIICGFLLAIMISGYSFISENVIQIDSDMLNAVLFSEGNGLMGRYSDDAGLSATISFLKDHPFQPIGLAFQDSLYATDSGPIVYYLRGSVFLVALMYLGVFLFMKKNLTNKKYLFILFSCYSIFEIGYPNFLIFRTQMLLPFILVYLNCLDNNTNDHSQRVHAG